jgi:vacuolar-type H+-ATPase subunit C/Vma6
MYVPPPSSTSVTDYEEVRSETVEDPSTAESIETDPKNATLEFLAKYFRERMIELILASSFGLTTLVEVMKKKCNTVRNVLFIVKCYIQGFSF